MGTFRAGAHQQRRDARLRRLQGRAHPALRLPGRRREFDAGFAKIKDRGIPYFAHPDKSGPGEINHYWGGRGVYFEDPNGHLLELITKPYGELPQ